MTAGEGKEDQSEVGGQRVGLATLAREWTRIGCIGFGGPPAHIVLLRRLCVQERKWISAEEFEDSIAVTNLLPGPASTQLAIYCAWRLRGTAGAVVGGLGFILPGLALILALAALLLAEDAPAWVRGAAAGAGAAVAAVAVHAAAGLVPASWRRAGSAAARRAGPPATPGGSPRPPAGEAGQAGSTGQTDETGQAAQAGDIGQADDAAGQPQTGETRQTAQSSRAAQAGDIGQTGEAGQAGQADEAGQSQAGRTGQSQTGGTRQTAQSGRAAQAGDIGQSDQADGTWRRVRAARLRWLCYATAGAVSAVLVGPWLVVVLVVAGLAEVALATSARPSEGRPRGGGGRGGVRGAGGLLPAFALPAAVSTGGLGALAWVAFKVGALSYGGGFVIIPLMQADAVDTYHWMTDGEFLLAVALGQITPGPVVQTVAVVGFAAAGLAGGLFAAAVAFGPSFLLILLGAARFDRLRSNTHVQAFFGGAGPAVIGAISGSAVPLALAIQHAWQVPVLAGAAVWLFAARRGVVSALLLAGAVGVGAALAGLPVTG